MARHILSTTTLLILSACVSAPDTLPPEILAIADEIDRETVQAVEDEDPFEYRATILERINYQEAFEAEEETKAAFLETVDARLAELLPTEEASLVIAFFELTAIMAQHTEYLGRESDNFIDFMPLEQGEEPEIRRLTQGEAIEILCVQDREHVPPTVFSCAKNYAFVLLPQSGAQFDGETGYFTAPAINRPDSTASFLALELMSDRGVAEVPIVYAEIGPPLNIDSSDFGTVIILIGEPNITGDLVFELRRAAPMIAFAAAPPPVLSAALQGLHDQLVVVSGDDRNIKKLKRDGVRENFALKEDILYCRETTGEVYLIPAGFITDLLSVKGLSAGLSSDKTTAGAIIHDWLFALGGGEAERKRAEAMFAEELKFARSGALRNFFITFGTDQLGPLYFSLFGKDSPFGRRDEMRFATKDSCRRGYQLRSGAERYIRGVINPSLPRNRRCRNFQRDYDQHVSTYATSATIDVNEIVRSNEKREFLRDVVTNKDHDKSCADF